MSHPIPPPKTWQVLGINPGPSPAARPPSPPSPASTLSTKDISPRTKQDAFVSPPTKLDKSAGPEVPEDAHTRWSTAPLPHIEGDHWRINEALPSLLHESLPKASTRAIQSNASALSTKKVAQEPQNAPAPPTMPLTTQAAVKGWRFSAVFATLCLGQLLAAFETTVTATALPAIVRELGSGDRYVWILNGYLLTSTISQPLYGQFAGIFGRRYPSLFAVTVFTLGSTVSGAAKSTTMLIAGRVVQGIGGGGIMVLTQIIVSDIIPQRQRSSYLGLIYGVFGLGLMLGPIMGGEIVEYTTWRWCFWVNVPMGGGILVMQYLFLQVTYKKVATFREKVRKIDWLGNCLLICSVVGILVALSWADTRYPWSDARVLGPLIAGFMGTVAFHAFENSAYCKIPTLPPRLWANRTCAAALALTFTQMMLTFWRTYFLPIYFQAVLLASPARSGVLLLPSFAASTPVSILAGVVLTKTGRYKPLHMLGFGILLLAAGLYTQFSARSGLLEVVIFQILAGVSTGCCLTTLLPAAQADMPQQLVAAVTGGFGFVRAYGSVWGVAIPAAVFNARFESLRWKITDRVVREGLGNGKAYSMASSTFVEGLDPRTRQEVIAVYSESLARVWQVAVGFSALCCVLVFLEKEVSLSKTVKSDFGLKERKVEGQKG